MPLRSSSSDSASERALLSLATLRVAMSQRILVIDDNSTVRRIVGRTLQTAGFEVSLAADGREGLDAANEHTPDLVLVDFVMPNMNGFQFCQELRKNEHLAQVPVVLMSAKAERIGDGFLAQTGAVDSIAKPFYPEALLAITTRALARAALTSTPPTDASSKELTAEPIAPQKSALETQRIEHRKLAHDIATQLASFITHAGELELDAPRLAERIIHSHPPEAILTFAAELGRELPALSGEIALEGRIEHIPLGDILQMLQHLQQTGLLEIRNGARVIHVSVSDGKIDLALLTRTPDSHESNDGEFLLGRYLARSEQIEKELECPRPSPRTLVGTHLVKLGLVTEPDLFHALTAQTSELVYEALRWKRGAYRFVRFAARPEAIQARLGLPIGAILMEGLRRVDEWKLIEEQLPSTDIVLRADTESVSTFEHDRLSEREKVVLAAIDGIRTIQDIIDVTRMGSFEASKILLQLLTGRFVRR